jgi:hypothetical protein
MLARKLDRYTYEDYDAYSASRYEVPKIPEWDASAKTGECNRKLRRRAASAVIMVLAFAFYMVMRSDIFIQNGYELTRLKKEEAEIIKQVEYLEVVLAQARSPERIAALAAQLGMAPAESTLYVEHQPFIEQDNAVSQTAEMTTAWRR